MLVRLDAEPLEPSECKLNKFVLYITIILINNFTVIHTFLNFISIILNFLDINSKKLLTFDIHCEDCVLVSNFTPKASSMKRIV